MISDLDHYYLRQEEPAKSCLLALREIILQHPAGLQTAWKYRMPFFTYRGKMFCYLWVDKKTKEPYIGIVEGRRIDHPLLIQGERSRMKILPVDPAKDIPVSTIYAIIDRALEFYE